MELLTSSMTPQSGSRICSFKQDCLVPRNPRPPPLHSNPAFISSFSVYAQSSRILREPNTTEHFSRLRHQMQTQLQVQLELTQSSYPNSICIKYGGWEEYEAKGR